MQWRVHSGQEHKIISFFKLEDHVVYSNQGCTNVIFAINAKTPRPEDWEVMKQVRKVIVDPSQVVCLGVGLTSFCHQKKKKLC